MRAGCCSIATSSWPTHSLRFPLIAAARPAGVERRGRIDQRHHRLDALTKIGQCEGSIRQDARIVPGYF
jgi:hypothetical protein